MSHIVQSAEAHPPWIRPFGQRPDSDDVRFEEAERIAFLKRGGMDGEAAYYAAQVSMHEDRDFAEGRIRSIRTFDLARRIRAVAAVPSERTTDGRDNPIVSTLVRQIHDEAIARCGNRETPSKTKEREAITQWYTQLIRDEYAADYVPDNYPNCEPELFVDVPQYYRTEAVHRGGWLILRGYHPDAAMIEAMRQIYAEFDEWREEGCEPITYKLMTLVSALFPLPLRRPSGCYTVWKVKTMKHCHRNGFARIYGGEYTEIDNDAVLRYYAQPHDVERVIRWYCDHITMSRINCEVEDGSK